MSTIVMGDSLAVLDPPTWVDLAWGPGGATNLAVSTTTSGWWVQQPELWLPLAQPGDAWWILLGTNDSIRPFWASYEANMTSIVTDLMDAGVGEIHVMHSPTLSPTRGTPESIATFNEHLGIYRDWDRALCVEHIEVHCDADLFAETLHPEHFMEDGVHFSAAGHAHIAALIPEPTPAFLLFAGLTLLGLAARRLRRLVV
jgi:lysophospholipase L1-like esterase